MKLAEIKVAKPCLRRKIKKLEDKQDAGFFFYELHIIKIIAINVVLMVQENVLNLGHFSRSEFFKSAVNFLQQFHAFGFVQLCLLMAALL